MIFDKNHFSSPTIYFLISLTPSNRITVSIIILIFYIKIFHPIEHIIVGEKLACLSREGSKYYFVFR